MTYPFDDLLASHYKKASNKEAFWGTVARGLGQAAKAVGNKVLGPSLTQGIGKVVPTAAKTVGGAVFGPGQSTASKIGFGAATAYGVGSAMNAGHNGPSINTPLGTMGGPSPQQGPKMASSLDESFVEKMAFQILGPKVAGDFSPIHRAVNAASYGAFMLPYLSKRVHDNQPLSNALNAAGLLGLGATSAHNLAHGDKPAAYDLAGLGLMGAGMLHSHLKNT